MTQKELNEILAAHELYLNHKKGGSKANLRCDEARPSNADHIRSMTDEELALFIDNLTMNCVDCESDEIRNDCPIHKIGFGCLSQSKRHYGLAQTAEGGRL